MKNYYKLNLVATNAKFFHSANREGFPFKDNTNVLAFEGASPETALVFETVSSEIFVESKIKNAIELNQLTGVSISFNVNNIFEIQQNLSNPTWSQGKTFWKTEIEKWNNECDFGIWDARFLLVSEKAFSILIADGGFQFEIHGFALGKSFEVISNVFYVGNSPQDYFSQTYLEEYKLVDEKTRLALDEYKRLMRLKKT